MMIATKKVTAILAKVNAIFLFATLTFVTGRLVVILFHNWRSFKGMERSW